MGLIGYGTRATTMGRESHFFDAFSPFSFFIYHVMTIEVPAGLRSWLFLSLLSLDTGSHLLFLFSIPWACDDSMRSLFFWGLFLFNVCCAYHCRPFRFNLLFFSICICCMLDLFSFIFFRVCAIISCFSPSFRLIGLNFGSFEGRPLFPPGLHFEDCTGCAIGLVLDVIPVALVRKRLVCLTLFSV